MFQNSRSSPGAHQGALAFSFFSSYSSFCFLKLCWLQLVCAASINCHLLPTASPPQHYVTVQRQYISAKKHYVTDQEHYVTSPHQTGANSSRSISGESEEEGRFMDFLLNEKLSGSSEVEKQINQSPFNVMFARAAHNTQQHSSSPSDTITNNNHRNRSPGFLSSSYPCTFCCCYCYFLGCCCRRPLHLNACNRCPRLRIPPSAVNPDSLEKKLKSILRKDKIFLRWFSEANFNWEYSLTNKNFYHFCNCSFFGESPLLQTSTYILFSTPNWRQKCEGKADTLAKKRGNAVPLASKLIKITVTPLVTRCPSVPDHRLFYCRHQVNLSLPGVLLQKQIIDCCLYQFNYGRNKHFSCRCQLCILFIKSSRSDLTTKYLEALTTSQTLRPNHIPRTLLSLPGFKPIASKHLTFHKRRREDVLSKSKPTNRFKKAAAFCFNGSYDENTVDVIPKINQSQKEKRVVLKRDVSYQSKRDVDRNFYHNLIDSSKGNHFEEVLEEEIALKRPLRSVADHNLFKRSSSSSSTTRNTLSTVDHFETLNNYIRDAEIVSRIISEQTSSLRNSSYYNTPFVISNNRSVNYCCQNCEIETGVIWEKYLSTVVVVPSELPLKMTYYGPSQFKPPDELLYQFGQTSEGDEFQAIIFFIFENKNRSNFSCLLPKKS